MAWTAAVTLASDAGQSPVDNYNNSLLLRHHFLGGAQPAGFTDGWIWADNTAAARIVWKFGQNSGTGIFIGYTGGKHVCEADLDFDSNAAVNMILEKLAVGAIVSTEARLFWQDTSNFLAWGDGTDTRYEKGTKADGTTFVRIPCAINVAQCGTPATANTSTIFGGWTLDAAAESMNLVATRPIPAGFTGAHDCRLDLDVLNLNAETANDTIDINGTWRSLSEGELPTKTATAFVAASKDITTANAQYELNRVELTVDYDHADNPIAADDVWIATISHDIAAGANPVAGIIVIGAYLCVPIFGHEDE